MPRPSSPRAYERRSARIGLVINSLGAAHDRVRAADRDHHEVHARRLPRVHRDPDPRDPHDRREPLLPRCRARDPASTTRRTSASEGDVALILVNRLQKPVVKAIDYALAAKHDKTLAVHVAVSDGGVRRPPAAVGRARDPDAAGHHRVAVPHLREPRVAVHQAVPRRSTARRSSPSTCRSTSSATGGSRSCTTAAPDASRTSSCSSTASRSRSCRGCSTRRELIYGRRSRPLPGQERAGIPAAQPAHHRASRPAGPPDPTPGS